MKTFATELNTAFTDTCIMHDLSLEPTQAPHSLGVSKKIPVRSSLKTQDYMCIEFYAQLCVAKCLPGTSEKPAFLLMF
jgi:hypothetical protein